jgi:F0F1-type ATP synthase membrane subunit c/vacuolar-type H+-ATPase subunit K
MNHIEVNPGDVVVSDFGLYQHWSLVSNKLCDNGRFMLISATERNGTVKEEPWSTVTKDKNTYIAKMTHSKPLSEVLKRARSKIGTWNYSVTGNNCEHFVKWAAGLEVSSTQVKAGIGGAIAGVAIVGAASENPNFIKFLGGAILVAGVAVAVAKATEKA